MEQTQNEMDIAWKLRKEHLLLQELAEHLRLATEDLPAGDRGAWLANLQTKFEHFRAHMCKRLALEEVGGFLRIVSDRHPTLAPQIQHLKQEHQKIVALMDAVQAELKTAAPAKTGLLKECVLRIRHILSEVDHHEEHENLLAEFVVSQEMGGEG